MIGIARLSPNYLINKTASFYVEFFRNVPLLLQIFFWYYAALRALPLPENTEALFGVTYLTVKGYYIPRLIWENFDILVYSILAAVISIVFIRNYARKLQEEKGQQLPVLLISVGLLFIFPAITFVTGMVQLEVALPVLKQLSKTSFIYAEGLSVPPELLALVLALSLYTATFVAECVRAGVQGVSLSLIHI